MIFLRHKFIFLLILFVAALLLNLGLGSVWIPVSSWKAFLSGEESMHSSIFAYRLSKAVTAVLAGGGLALSGLIMQNIFRNPVAGPYVLGLSSGAGLGVALLVLGGSMAGAGFEFFSQTDIVLAAATGSALTLLLVVSLYYKLKNPVSLLIAGLMIGIFAGAIVNILSYFTQAEALQGFVFWSMGNLGGLAKSDLLILFFISVLALAVSVFYIKDMNALLLGENYAASMGVNIRRVHLVLIAVTGIWVGSITAFAGPIAFVGLAVPHLSRLYLKTQLHQYLIPATVLTGAITLLLCDMIAQVPGSVLVLPINSITALFGAPLVVYLIYKKAGNSSLPA